ncbi:hypothetical protein N9X57_04365 [Candidatus Pelagibacter bacterium]|nr:hypothetical protein [Candidatus Pelagibacter bacterium]
MKRLLAYLFIVLGLGLTFSVNAEAKRYYCVHKDAKSTTSILQMYPEIFKKSKADYFRVQSKANCGYGNNNTFINVSASKYERLTKYFKRQQLREKYYKPDAVELAKSETSQSYEVGIKCFNPANNKIETWSSYDTCPGNRTLVKSSIEKTIYRATATGEHITVYNKVNNNYFNAKSYLSMNAAKNSALNKCKKVSNDCRIYSTQVIRNGVLGEEVLSPQEPSQSDLEEEKKRIAQVKKKKEEEEKKRIAQAKKKKQEEQEQKRIAEAKKKEEEEQKYRILVKKYGDDCKDNSLGSPEFNKCLKDVEAEDLLQAKLQREFLASLSPEEARAYTCNNTFGFRKGSSNFKDCIFKLYTTELELEKLDLEKQLALAKVEAEKAKADTARAQVEIIQARSAAARAEGKLQEAQIQATKAQTLSMQQQAAASRQQAAAAQAQARAAQQQNSLNLMTQGLKMLSGNQSSSSRLRTNCSWSSIGISCR